jgi:hypothetical protein
MAIGHKERIKDDQKPTPTRVYSKKQETEIAATTGGQRTPNSGATTWSKGDVLTEQFLLEAKTKTTHSDSIKINKEWFEKNRQEMAFMGKPHSAIVFNFGPGEENHYIIDEYLFLELLDYLKDKE